MYPDQPKPSFAERNHVITRCIVAGALVLIMLISLSFARSLVEKRQQRQATVVNKVINTALGYISMQRINKLNYT